MDIYRTIHSWGFCIGILSTVAAFYYGSVGMVSKDVSAVTGFNNTLKYNNISQLLILSSTFAYAASFCIDWQSRFALPIIIRSEKMAYALSKCIVNSVAGGLAVAIGAALFMGYVCVLQPSIMPKQISIKCEFSWQAFGDLLVKGEAALFFLSYLYVIFLQAFFFSSLGLMISAYIPNKYVAYIFPFVLSFMLNNIANTFHLPIWLDPVKLATARIFGVSTSTILWMATASFISLTILCDIIFIHKVHRRIANG